MSSMSSLIGITVLVHMLCKCIHYTCLLGRQSQLRTRVKILTRTLLITYGNILYNIIYNYILKTPNLVFWIGLLSEALIHMASTPRVSTGSMTPSSQSLALE